MEKRNEVKKQPVGWSKQSEFVRRMEEKARPVFLVIGRISECIVKAGKDRKTIRYSPGGGVTGRAVELVKNP